jgi:hypothetical protein
MRTAHTLALWLFAAMAVLAPRLAHAARVVYKCVPSPGHPCPGTVVIRPAAPPPAPATEPATSVAAEQRQDERIEKLEQSSGQFRVELGTTFDTDGNIGGLLGVGGSWHLGQNFAIADAELLVGGSEAGNDGFLLGTRGDVLFVATQWLRLGVGGDLLLNLGGETVHFDPSGVIEVGSEAIHFDFRQSAQIVVANGSNDTIFGPMGFGLYFGGRW